MQIVYRADRAHSSHTHVSAYREPDPWIRLDEVAAAVIAKLATRISAPPAVLAAHAQAAGLGPKEARL